ncbi:DoxX family protein [Herpetosiphon giganteus]|uniref:DoxX family protein n=1 Tax=Herpetosiphon giganteus TaxID=2029754 RepID=UPI00195B79CD|nr:DoxX family protein [Herpetosiphon giganteus]MBM7845766.1 putative oxidoreductase [Herpetosiphon giganteus]
MKSAQLSAIAWTLLRVVVGVVFVVHGWSKVTMIGDIAATFGNQYQLPIPAVLAWLVATVEFLGGLALTVGVYSRWAALLLGCVMLGAIKVHWGKFFYYAEGMEYDLVLLTICIVIGLNGGGPYSVDEMVLNKPPAKKPA